MRALEAITLLLFAVVVAVFAATLVVGCDASYVSPVQCDRPCYSGAPDTEGEGRCVAGWPVCDENKRVILCEGEVLPIAELCNEIDDDCDGKIDNGLTCLTPSPEECNGRDDDLDGQIDDNIAFAGPCYSGSPSEIVAGGRCRAGVLACRDGERVCFGEVTAEQERCNGIDDDCNGRVDDLPGVAPAMVDIVLLLDRSASMEGERATIETGLADFVLTHSTEVFRYAVLDVPGMGGTDGFAKVRTDFVSGFDALPIVSSIALGYGSDEPCFDALYDVAKENTALSWRTGAARVDVLFTDEAWRSWRGLNEHDAANALSEARHRFYGYITEPAYAPLYEVIAQATDGAVFSLPGAPLYMSEQISFESGECE